MIYTNVGINGIFKQKYLMGSSVISYILFFHQNNCTHSTIVNFPDYKYQLLVIIYIVYTNLYFHKQYVSNQYTFYNFSNVVVSGNTEPWRPLATKVSYISHRTILVSIQLLAAGVSRGIHQTRKTLTHYLIWKFLSSAIQG